ncbi:MAG: hypothetical protein L0338_38980, partial [Acidobacteria bacterium]|nr:hypothetical protein [Acidobacteriota bacterium]
MNIQPLAGTVVRGATGLTSGGGQEMERRRYCEPALITGDKELLRLERVPLEQRLIDEGWLQELLRAQPGLLPLAEIEPAFAPAITIGREVSTKVGPIDNLYISPAGYP